MTQVQHKYNTLNEISELPKTSDKEVNKLHASDSSRNFTWLFDLRLNFKLDTTNT